jgi:hypothetical protein
LLLTFALAVHGCQREEAGNPLPPASAITGAEFLHEYGPTGEMQGPGIPIPIDRVAELRRLFDGSRIDHEPARWALWGQLKLFLKGGGTEVYDIYSTGNGAGAYADHLRRYFRGGSDAAFAEFLKNVEQAKTKQ